MNVSVLNQAFQYVDDKYLDIVEQERILRAKSHKRPMPYWGKVAVACFCLILILAVLPIVAIAANWFGLRDLLIPEVPSDPPVQNEEHSGNVQQIPETGMPDQGDERASEFIGLSGYQGSPEGQALAEWQAFLATYDTDRTILEEIGNGPAETDDTRYGLYGVYTQDMADKLEEIIQKYGLKLHTDINVVSQEELVFRIGDVSDYQEFEYVTSSGERVSCALGSDKALIYMDSESCFILMNVMGGSNCGVTRRVLEDIADSIDFTLLKDVQVPEMRGNSVP